MAINHPSVIGMSARCIICGWIFRRPIAQRYRMRCYTCQSKKFPFCTPDDED